MVWIAWMATWVLELRFLDQRNRTMGKEWIPAALMMVYVVWELVSMTWSPDSRECMRVIERHLSVPVVLLVALYGVNDHYRAERFLPSFVGACLASAVLYFFAMYAAYEHQALLDNWRPEMVDYTMQVDKCFSSILKHRLFYSMTLTMAIMSLPIIFKDKVTAYPKALVWATSGIAALGMVGTIYMTGSRTSIVTLLGLILVVVCYQCAKHKKWVAGVIVAVAIIGAFLAFKTLQPRMHNVNEDPRWTIWRISWEHIDEVPFWGMGTGQHLQPLSEWFKAGEFNLGVEAHYSTHNQYLGTFMTLGPIAVLLLVGMLVSLPLCSRGKARYIGLCMCLMYGLNMFTDDLMERIDPLLTWYAMMVLYTLMNREETSKQVSDRKETDYNPSMAE